MDSAQNGIAFAIPRHQIPKVSPCLLPVCEATINDFGKHLSARGSLAAALLQVPASPTTKQTYTLARSHARYTAVYALVLGRFSCEPSTHADQLYVVSGLLQLRIHNALSLSLRHLQD